MIKKKLVSLAMAGTISLTALASPVLSVAASPSTVSEIENISFISEQTASSSEEVTASTEEITATMEELSSHSSELQMLAQKLGDEISRFKTK